MHKRNETNQAEATHRERERESAGYKATTKQRHI